MRFEFRLPDVGEGITESELLAWHVAPGERGARRPDPVRDRDRQGDGGNPGAVQRPGGTTGGAGRADRQGRRNPGRVRRRARARAAVLGREARRAGAGADPAAAPARHSRPARVRAAPSTRRYAHQQDVDLATVTGSGPKGRVLREDIDAVLARVARPAPTPTSAPSPAMPRASPRRRRAALAPVRHRQGHVRQHEPRRPRAAGDHRLCRERRRLRGRPRAPGRPHRPARVLRGAADQGADPGAQGHAAVQRQHRRPDARSRREALLPHRLCRLHGRRLSWCR